jgi:S-adenosylmethionine hydrolase
VGRWRAVVRDRRAPLLGAYAEATPGALLALVNSYGLVELAVRDGNAARQLGLGLGDHFRLERDA